MAKEGDLRFCVFCGAVYPVHVFSTLRRGGNRPLVTCSRCGGKPGTGTYSEEDPSRLSRLSAWRGVARVLGDYDGYRP